MNASLERRSISNAGLAMIKRFEGLRLVAYQDSVGVWTIGYGHTRAVRSGDVCTEAEADTFLRDDCREAEVGVNWLIKVPITQSQFDALMSFSFNLGTDIDEDFKAEGLGDSTLLKKLNLGDHQGAADEFLRWNKAGGKVLAGLTARREAERELFLRTPT